MASRDEEADREDQLRAMLEDEDGRFRPYDQRDCSQENFPGHPNFDLLTAIKLEEVKRGLADPP